MNHVQSRIGAVALLLFATAPAAQSGRGAFHGYVAFDDVAYGEAPAAQVTLDGVRPGEKLHYAVQADRYGRFDPAPISWANTACASKRPAFRTTRRRSTSLPISTPGSR